MKVTREQAAENRNRIIKVASELFRERGFDGIGIAEVMQAAGLTHGGFYGHFRSKEDLAAQACARTLEKTGEKWTQLVDGGGDNPLSGLIAHYLSKSHRDEPGKGCILAALGGDAARQGDPVKRRFTNGVSSLAEVLTNVLPGRSAAARRRKALAIMAEMIGAMVVARAVDDSALSTEILEAVRIDLGGKPASN